MCLCVGILIAITLGSGDFALLPRFIVVPAVVATDPAAAGGYAQVIEASKTENTVLM